ALGRRALRAIGTRLAEAARHPRTDDAVAVEADLTGPVAVGRRLAHRAVLDVDRRGRLVPAAVVRGDLDAVLALAEIDRRGEVPRDLGAGSEQHAVQAELDLGDRAVIRDLGLDREASVHLRTLGRVDDVDRRRHEVRAGRTERRHDE